MPKRLALDKHSHSFSFGQAPTKGGCVRGAGFKGSEQKEFVPGWSLSRWMTLTLTLHVIRTGTLDSMLSKILCLRHSVTNKERISSHINWLNEVYGFLASERLSSKDRDVGFVRETEGPFPIWHFIMIIFKYASEFEGFENELLPT